MENSNSRKTSVMDLTTGPIFRTLFLFSYPFMLSTFLQTAYTTTDTIVVGQFLGSAGISAVSNGSQLMNLLYGLCMGFSSATQVLIAQARGAKQYEKMEKIIGTSFVILSAFSVVIGVLCAAFSTQLLNALHTPPEAFDQARYYIVICGIGVVATGFYNMFSAVLRGMGDSKHPLLFVAIATSLNIVLDIVFIAVFHWNVAGAALATVIGQIVSVVFSFRFLAAHAKEYDIRFGRDMLHVEPETAQQLLAIGAPMGFQMAAVSISFLFVSSMINRLGVTVSAAFGVMQKIRQLPGFITMGFGTGAASMMGQNLGARKLDRVDKVVKYTILITMTVDAVAAVFYLTVPELCFRLFTQDATVLVLAPMCLFILAIELPANFFMPACNSLISAQGFVKLSFTIAILDAFAGRVFFCWLFGSVLQMGTFGYFLGYIMGTYVTAMIALGYYLSGKWKKRAALV